MAEILFPPTLANFLKQLIISKGKGYLLTPDCLSIPSPPPSPVRFTGNTMPENGSFWIYT